MWTLSWLHDFPFFETSNLEKEQVEIEFRRCIAFNEIFPGSWELRTPSLSLQLFTYIRDVSHFSTSFQSEEHISYLVKSWREDRRYFSFPRPTKILQGDELVQTPLFRFSYFWRTKKTISTNAESRLAIRIHSIVALEPQTQTRRQLLETSDIRHRQAPLSQIWTSMDFSHSTSLCRKECQIENIVHSMRGNTIEDCGKWLLKDLLEDRWSLTRRPKKG